MISERESSTAPLLWITGLSGVGKSSLAQAVAKQLRARGERPLLLDGDTLRDALEAADNATSHDLASRERRAWRIARLAQLAAKQGVPVIVASISLFHAVQRFNRATHSRYAEVWLQASLAELRARNPALYGPAGDPTPRQVMGLDQPAQFPERADLVIAQQFGPQALADQLEEVLVLWQKLCEARP